MLKKITEKYKSSGFYEWFNVTLPMLQYTKWLKKLSLDESAILLESHNGNEIYGNVFYLLKELATNDDYSKYNIYLTCKDANKDKFKKILNKNGLKKVTLVPFASKEYMKLLASAKYIMADVSMSPMFVKKRGQVYLNTWHGTPLKTLGKKVNNSAHSIGNVQKNFVCADFLLYPNEYTKGHMIEDYMLENIARGKAILAGYPRNTAFFDTKKSEKIIEALNLEGKRIYAYMPTWRGVVGGITKSAGVYLKYYLYELDEVLSDDELLYVNLHPLAAKDVDFSVFKHIRNFPAEYETYEFLNCAECLVTDYSSVFYDFAISQKKIILFTYDEEEYFADRGVYKPISELPFTNVKTVEELIKEMRTPKQYADEEFLKEYCSYDRYEVTKEILDYVLLGKKSEKLLVEDIPNNGKKNIVMYAGNMDKNGITTAIFNLLKNVDTSELNFYVAFHAGKSKNHQDNIVNLPEGVSYFPVQGPFNLGYFKTKLWESFNDRKFPVGLLMKLLKTEWKYEILRTFGGADFHSAIQFNGYETKSILLFSQFECKKSIYVHSDMVKEIETRGNQRRSVLEYAYSHYDNVVMVTEDIRPSVETFVKSYDNLKIAHNLIAYEEIAKRGKKEIEFDKTTKCNRSLEDIKEIVNSDAKVIVSVGRYSPEKDHRRMIDAFNTVWKENNNTYFIIIGGNQRDGLYNELCSYVEELPCKQNIILVLSMSNPMPLVKACDGFILASHYEGFGLVIVEADVLGVPAVSTDITGPRIFMKNNNGVLVENSAEGVEKGFRMLIDGQVPLLTANYAEYNKQAIEEFKKII